MLTITRNAVERYQQRVEPVSEDIARARLSTKAFQCAEMFGARIVILPTGQRLVIEGDAIVTVLSRKVRTQKSTDRREWDGE
jgi:hypothetical protein